MSDHCLAGAGIKLVKVEDPFEPNLRHEKKHHHANDALAVATGTGPAASGQLPSNTPALVATNTIHDEERRFATAIDKAKIAIAITGPVRRCHALAHVLLRRVRRGNGQKEAVRAAHYR